MDLESPNTVQQKMSTRAGRHPAAPGDIFHGISGPIYVTMMHADLTMSGLLTS